MHGRLCRPGLRWRRRSLRGTRRDIVGPKGIGTCGPDHGTTDQGKHGGTAAALARRIVHLRIVPTNGSAAIKIVSALMRDSRNARGPRRVLLTPIEPACGDLRCVTITAVRMRMLFVPIRRTCMIDVEPPQTRVRRYINLIKRRAEAAGCLSARRGRSPARAPLDLHGDRVPVAPKRTACAALAEAREPIRILAVLVQ